MNPSLLKKYLNGDTTPRENAEVYNWIKKSEANESEFLAMRRLHDVYIWNENSPIEKKEVKKSTTKPFLYSMIRIAGIFLLGVVIFYFYQKSAEKDAKHITPMQASILRKTSVSVGQYQELLLEDGTKVWLNSRSSLIYPTKFNDSERIVTLEGEGYFAVNHDANRPFRVIANGYTIEVLGTEFNVKSYQNPKYTSFETSLVKGRVSIEEAGSSQKLYLNPNEKAVKTDSNLKLYPLDKNDFLWREGILFIDNKTFNEIIPILEQYFGIKVVVEKDVSKIQKRYTGKFRMEEGIEQILNVFQTQYGFNYKKETPNHIIIR